MQKKSSPPTALTPSLRRYLYCTAAVTGAAVMVIEILGARMLAPYVGTSHFVWTAQIAVTLVALAVGYYFGGVLADRGPRLRRLYVMILIAGVYLCVSGLVVRPVAFWCLDFRLAAGSLLASMILFFVPLALLAMVTPFFIRAIIESLASAGHAVGRFTAVSTAGSFAGTMLIGYLFIPFLPNSITLYCTAGALLVTSAIYFLIWERRSALTVTVVFLMAGAAGYFGVRQQMRDEYATVEELYRGNSHFGQLQVFQSKNGLRRYYLNDYLFQNVYDPLQKKSTSLFTYMLHGLSRAYTADLKKALCIGLGVGIVPMEFAREGVDVEVVEINRAVVRVATNFFNCDSSKFKLNIEDGRYFLNRSKEKYDTIILDAFLGDSSPSHLMTREAFQSMRDHLRPGGTLVINSFGSFTPGQDMFTASLSKTLRAVFRTVRIHHEGGYGTGNVFFVASMRDDLNFVHTINIDNVHEAVRDSVRATFEGLAETNPQHGLVLTDDYNPVEYYDAANREEHRIQLARSMHSL